MFNTVTKNTRQSDWLLQKPHTPEIHHKVLTLEAGFKGVSGTVLVDRGNGIHRKLNADTDGVDVDIAGVLLTDADAIATYAAHTFGVSGINGYTIRANTIGYVGNQIIFEAVNPDASNSPASVSTVGDTFGGFKITFNLATDESGLVTTTPAELQESLERLVDEHGKRLVNVAIDGSQPLDAVSPTNLIGGVEYAQANEAACLCNMRDCLLRVGGLKYDGENIDNVINKLEAAGAFLAKEMGAE